MMISSSFWLNIRSVWSKKKDTAYRDAALKTETRESVSDIDDWLDGADDELD